MKRLVRVFLLAEVGPETSDRDVMHAIVDAHALDARGVNVGFAAVRDGHSRQYTDLGARPSEWTDADASEVE